MLIKEFAREFVSYSCLTDSVHVPHFTVSLYFLFPIPETCPVIFRCCCCCLQLLPSLLDLQQCVIVVFHSSKIIKETRQPDWGGRTNGDIFLGLIPASPPLTKKRKKKKKRSCGSRYWELYFWYTYNKSETIDFSSSGLNLKGRVLQEDALGCYSLLALVLDPAWRNCSWYLNRRRRMLLAWV